MVHSLEGGEKEAVEDLASVLAGQRMFINIRALVRTGQRSFRIYNNSENSLKI